jgi:phosphatidylglycerol:prolipoprotein diacylglycerol transferase
MLLFPYLNPVALELGPLAIHWYGLAYVVALAGGLWLAKRLTTQYPANNLKPETLEDFFLWAVLGVIVGGRLGYILFYNLQAYLAEPFAVLRVWEGGMAFHGGVLGVVIALLLFAKRRQLNVFDLADRVAPVVPLGCLLGRVANFVNGELVGRPAPEGLPWAMIFPHVDSIPRHPSQLYQAALEGLVVGAVVLIALRWWGRHGTPRGFMAGVWLLGYGLARLVGETFRTPEIAYLYGTLTQGMLLSIPMVLTGLYLLARAR